MFVIREISNKIKFEMGGTEKLGKVEKLNFSSSRAFKNIFYCSQNIFNF
jgi:hypothetical protein